jgi:peptidoglycan hydrolase-like protein with peptidoglycan-binding domain
MKNIAGVVCAFGLVLLLSPSVSLAAQDSCPVLRNTLTYGATDARTNKEVSLLQKFLYPKYLNSSSTGYFGSATVNAVKAFQKANGLEANGSVGPLTRAKIRTCPTIVSPANNQPTNTTTITALAPAEIASYASSLVTSLLKVLTPQEGVVISPGKTFKVSLLYPEKGATYTVSLADTSANILTNLGTLSVPADITTDSYDGTFSLPATLSPKESGYRISVTRSTCAKAPCQMMALPIDGQTTYSNPVAIGPLFNVRPDASIIEAPVITGVSSKGLSAFQIQMNGVATITGTHLTGPASINSVQYTTATEVYVAGIKAKVISATDTAVSFQVPENLILGTSDLYLSFGSLSGAVFTSQTVQVKVIKVGTSDIVPSPHMSVGLSTDILGQATSVKVGQVLYRHLDDGCPTSPGLCGFSYNGRYTVSQAPNTNATCNLIPGTFPWVEGTVSRADTLKLITPENAGCQYLFTYQVTNQLGVSRSVENTVTILP